MYVAAGLAHPDYGVSYMYNTKICRYLNTRHLLNPPRLAQFISQYFYLCKSSATPYPEKPFQGGWLFLRGSRYILGYLGDNGPQKYGTKIIIFRAKKIESQIICKTIERNFKGMVH